MLEEVQVRDGGIANRVFLSHASQDDDLTADVRDLLEFNGIQAFSTPGGGKSTGPASYMSNIPPWQVFIAELERRGMHQHADLIKAHLP